MTEEQKRLVTENHNLIYGFLCKHKLPQEEYYGVAAYGLCQAAITYNEEKAGFPSYAYKCMLNAILFEKRKNNASKRMADIIHSSLDSPIESENEQLSLMDILPSGNSTQEEALALIILERYFDTVSERDRKILELFYLGYKSSEIEKMFNISHTTVSKVRNKFKNYLQ